VSLSWRDRLVAIVALALLVSAHLYRGGPHAIVLAHGGVFDKESWSGLAASLLDADLTALAFDFRGYGGGEPEYGLRGKRKDVLAAIEYLNQQGYEQISVVGGSMGAQFSMAASAETDQIDLLVLLAPGSDGLAARIQARSTLFIVAEGDRLRPKVEDEYRAAPEPKHLEILPGSTHAQHLFATEHAAALTELIVDYLTTE
jgi:pimeloyl-ACP methyl ester carboxylesterase